MVRIVSCSSPGNNSSQHWSVCHQLHSHVRMWGEGSICVIAGRTWEYGLGLGAAVITAGVRRYPQLIPLLCPGLTWNHESHKDGPLGIPALLEHLQHTEQSCSGASLDNMWTLRMKNCSCFLLSDPQTFRAIIWQVREAPVVQPAAYSWHRAEGADFSFLNIQNSRLCFFPLLLWPSGYQDLIIVSHNSYLIYRFVISLFLLLKRTFCLPNHCFT